MDLRPQAEPDGRQQLRAWLDAQPNNFFEADHNLQRVLRMYWGEAHFRARQPQLSAFGHTCATTIDVAARLNDRIGNHPVLDRYNGIGERSETVQLHPSYHVAGRAAYESGILAIQAQPGYALEQSALFYLLCHAGEMGHACPIACTSGMIQALQRAADPALRERMLPPLLRRSYDELQHGAQFLTEVGGGSDVGANVCQATPLPGQPGRWQISGEKWFCSNINADQFLMTARVHPEGGTRGLGLFLVPRRLPDGTLNGFFIRRLKDKLGTRTLASTELDFKDAVAYAVGPVDKGFKTVVELVLNTSRLMNAVACAGLMQRASLEAATYAATRTAFGQPLLSYPLVQEALADLQAETAAAVSSSFALASLVDRIDTAQATAEDKAVYRLLVNMNKYITSIQAQQMIHRAIEVLGGNGAIETFSILPRLYRDIVVLESWEGTHNVLCLQILRDAQRQDLVTPYAAWLRGLLDTVTDERLLPLVTPIQQAVVTWEMRFATLQTMDDAHQNAHARRWTDQMAVITQAALLLAEAQAEQTQTKADLASIYLNRHDPSYDAFTDSDYTARLARLTHQV